MSTSAMRSLVAMLSRFAAVGLLCAARPATAQSAPSATDAASRASLGGDVVAEGSRLPVDGALITVVELSRSATTDAKGAFLIAGMPPGEYMVVLHRMGFAPLRTRIHLDPSQRLDVDIELSPVSAVTLDPLQVSASMDRQSADILRRRATAQGTFFLRGTLDSLRGTSVGELLRREAKGAHLIRYTKTGALLVATNRGMGTISLLPLADPNDGRSPRACFAQVIVDGVRVYAPDAVNRFPAPNLDQYDAGTLEAVEFYAGPATTPPEFVGAGAQCGTLMLWTRRSR